MNEHSIGTSTSNEVRWMAQNLKFVRVRNDLLFEDADHLGEDQILAVDPLAWTYRTISQLDYYVLEAIDSCESIAEVVKHIHDRFGLSIGEDRVWELLKRSSEARSFELWSYTTPIDLRADTIRALKTLLEHTKKVAGESYADSIRALEEALATRNAVAVARACQHEGELLDFAAPIYNALLQGVIRRQRVVFEFYKSRIDIFDPSKLLRILKPLLGWIHDPRFVLLSAPFALYALVRGMTQHGEIFLFHGWTGVEVFFVAPLAWTAVLLHETLGHALALNYFGGRVPTVGVLIFMGIMPAGFANVSDVYRQKSRWRRIWVSLAGMWVNLWLGIFFISLLDHVPKGTTLEVVVRISTIVNLGGILPNLMPWLPLDGYYALTDLLKSPNLRERAIDVMRRITAWITFGQEPNLKELALSKTEMRASIGFMLFQVLFFVISMPFYLAISVERMLSLFGIAGLGLLALGMRSLFSTIFGALIKGSVFRSLLIWLRPQRAAVAAVLVYAGCIHDWPVRRSSVAVLEPNRRLDLSAPSSGEVTYTVANPTEEPHVAAGAKLVTLRNDELEEQRKAIQADVEVHTAARQMKEQGETSLERHARASRLKATRTKEHAARREANSLAKDRSIRSDADLGAALATMSSAAEKRLSLEADASKAERKMADEAVASRIELEQAQARLRAIEQSLNALELSAPFAGTFIPEKWRAGDRVAAGTKLGLLVDDSRLHPVITLKRPFPIDLLDQRAAVRLKLFDERSPWLELPIERVELTDNGDARLHLETIPGAETTRVGMRVLAEVSLSERPFVAWLAHYLFKPIKQLLTDILKLG